MQGDGVIEEIPYGADHKSLTIIMVINKRILSLIREI